MEESHLRALTVDSDIKSLCRQKINHVIGTLEIRKFVNKTFPGVVAVVIT